MRLKIWHKMIIGITIPSLIAVLGGVLTYGYINDVKSRQGFMRISDNLKEQVLEIRRNEKNFLHYRNDDSLKGLNRAISAFNVSAGNISPKIAGEIGSREFSIVKELLGEYSGTIKELNESFRSETAVAEKVRTEGAMLERLVAGKKHAKELSTDFVLRLRLLEKNYMFYRDRNSYTALDKGLLQIKNMMPFCYDCVPYIESVHELFTKYGNSDQLMAGLQKAGDNLEQVTGEIASRERQKITSFITNTQKLLLAALILLFLLGPYFVYRTASYIVAPIKRLADITQKIS
ncbi:MAG: hypothetical protein OEU95_05685, partial [Nitrospirota bacterium]|nr:hypothetical protein [Nitrospirota bacterium]